MFNEVGIISLNQERSNLARHPTTVSLAPTLPSSGVALRRWSGNIHANISRIKIRNSLFLAALTACVAPAAVFETVNYRHDLVAQWATAALPDLIGEIENGRISDRSKNAGKMPSGAVVAGPLDACGFGKPITVNRSSLFDAGDSDLRFGSVMAGYGIVSLSREGCPKAEVVTVEFNVRDGGGRRYFDLVSYASRGTALIAEPTSAIAGGPVSHPGQDGLTTSQRRLAYAQMPREQRRNMAARQLNMSAYPASAGSATNGSKAQQPDNLTTSQRRLAYGQMTDGEKYQRFTLSQSVHPDVAAAVSAFAAPGLTTDERRANFATKLQADRKLAASAIASAEK